MVITILTSFVGQRWAFYELVGTKFFYFFGSLRHFNRFKKKIVNCYQSIEINNTTSVCCVCNDPKGISMNIHGESV